MTDKELRKLQESIGKFSSKKDTEIIIKQIEKLDNKKSLTENEWNNLFYPACANSNVEVVKYILEKNNYEKPKIEEFMLHTVQGKENRYEYILRRIETLKAFIPYIKEDDYEQVISEVLITASWYGQIGVVKFLIDNGANIRYKDKNQRDAFEYAKIYSEKFMDDTLYQYLKPYYESGKELGSTEAYYGI